MLRKWEGKQGDLLREDFEKLVESLMGEVKASGGDGAEVPTKR